MKYRHQLAMTIAWSVFALSVTPVQGAEKQTDIIRANLTAQMVQDGKADETRLFIMEFYYSASTDGSVAPACVIQKITVNNLTCAKQAGQEAGIWLKPELASKEWNGDEFKCDFKPAAGNQWELSISEPIDGGQINHRLLLEGERKNGVLRTVRPVDYAGQLSKTSYITGKIETASYRPVKSGTRPGFDNVSLGCQKLEIPVIGK